MARGYSGRQILEKDEGAIFFRWRQFSYCFCEVMMSGLEAAADAYSARAPYQWKVPGEKFSAIADAVNTAGHGTARSCDCIDVSPRRTRNSQRDCLRQNFAVTEAELANCVCWRASWRRCARLWFSRNGASGVRDESETAARAPCRRLQRRCAERRKQNPAAN